MKKQDMKAAIREFLSRSLRGHTLNDDDDIFSLGLCPFVIYCANHTVYRKKFSG